MKPTVGQLLIAQGWPIKLTLAGGTIGIMAWCGRDLIVAVQPTVFSIAWFVFLMIVAGVLGFIVSAIAGGMFFIGPLYRWQGKRNGAPYRVGDYVMILAGPHRDTVARVYEIWAEREEVRVELGEAARESVDDVFSYAAVCRCTERLTGT